MKLENRIRTLLLKLGIDPSNKGYDYLVEAIQMCYGDRKCLFAITSILYPTIAKNNSASKSAVERAMRQAIFRAINTNYDAFDLLIFPISYDSGSLTNSQFIGACVEYLKMHEE